MLHDIDEGDGEDDEGYQFCGLRPASLAPLAQPNGEDDHRNGDDEQEQRGHSLESISMPLGALGKHRLPSCDSGFWSPTRRARIVANKFQPNDPIADITRSRKGQAL